MNQIKFTVEGKIKGKDRPRATRFGRMYTPKETINYEDWVRWCYRDQVGNEYVNYFKVKFYCDIEYCGKSCISIMYVTNEFETMAEAKRFIRESGFKGVLQVESE